MGFKTLTAWYSSVPEKRDRVALKDDDEGAGEVPADCDRSNDPYGDDKVLLYFEEAKEEEEDRKLDECHAQLVEDLGRE